MQQESVGCCRFLSVFGVASAVMAAKQSIVSNLGHGPTGLARTDPRLKKFLVTYRDTGSLRSAAAAADISPEYAYNLIARADVQALLRQSMMVALADDAQASRRFLRSILDGTVFPDQARSVSDSALKIRADAAKVLLDRAGYVPPKADAPGAGGAMRDPSEMSSDELRAFIEKAEAQLGARAQPVEVARQNAPNDDASSQQVIDMLG